MSFNQSRGDKNDAQTRRPGRSGVSAQSRAFLGGGRGSGRGSGGGGGVGFAPPVPAPVASNVANTANRSFRKPGDVQGGQPRGLPVENPQAGMTGSSPYARAVGNGPQSQPPIQAPPDPSVVSVMKPVDVSAPKPSRAVPRPPSSQSSSGPPDSSAPATTTKGDGKPFTLQFGSITPGFVNGMQIPARTSSAPPNLDEQKKDQTSHGMYGVASSTMPLSSIAKQQRQLPPRKDANDSLQANLGTPHSHPESKKDKLIHMSTPASMPSQKSSGLAVSGMSTPIFQQQAQMPMQFGGPNVPMQSQHLPPGSLQMPIAPMPMGNSPQMFVPSLQPHVLHQGQVGFPTHMGHRMTSTLGNVGMGIGAQFSPQQTGQFGGSRKTSVKITHPVTHEELRLDKKPDSFIDHSGQRSNLPAQTQPPAFPNPQISFFQNLQPNYPPGLFYPPLPLSNAQPTVSQNPRFNFPVVQSGIPISIVNPSTLTSVSVAKPAPNIHKDSEQSHIGHSHGGKAPLSVTISAPVQIKPPVTVAIDKPGIPSSDSAATINVKFGTPLQEFSQQRDGKVEVATYEQLSSEKSPLGVPAPMDLHVLPASQLESESSPPAIVSDTVLDSTYFSACMNNKKKELHSSDSFKEDNKKSDTVVDGHIQQEQAVSLDSSNALNVLSTESTNKGISTSSDKHILGNSECIDSISQTKEVPAGSSYVPPTVEHGASSGAISKNGKNNVTPDSSLTNGYICSSEPTTSNIDVVPCHEFDIQSDASPQKEAVEGVEKLESADVVVSSLVGSQAENDLVSCDKSPQDESLSGVTNIGMSKKMVTSEHSNIYELSNDDGKMEECMQETNGALKDVVNNNTNSVGSTDADINLSSSVRVPEANTPELDDAMLKNRYLPDSEIAATMSTKPSHHAPLGFDSSDKNHRSEEKAIEAVGFVSRSSSMAKERPTLEINRTKTATGKKKKKKEILSRADAAGTNTDLYMAYKGPEEQQTIAILTEGMEGSSVVDGNKPHADETRNDFITKEDSISKTDIDDWEDAEISSPKLEAYEKSGQHLMAKKLGHELGGAVKYTKKYSRDFLLTFSDQFIELPFGFEMGSDIAALLSVPMGTSHPMNNEMHAGRARIIDRPNSSNRADRRTMGYLEDDKWSKSTNPFPSRETGPGLRTGQGGAHGVLRNPRGQGGILSGQIQPVAGQGVPRNNADADRWQRAPGMQKGLIPSPHAPAQVMHKAEKRYEVGQVSDEEEAKQRQIKAILNKLTPQNFDRLFQQVKELNIDNTVTLTGVISQIFDKALTEPTFCEMYANFCSHLASALPDFNEDNEKITFKRLLLNKCQEEFERGEREQAEADKAEEEGEVKLSEEAKEKKRILVRRRMLGNIRLIGELYKKKMLTERIMHECIKKLLGQNQNPDEEDIEALCKLMSTIGEIIDHIKAKEHMDAYFVIMKNLSNNQKLSSRVRFMLKDAIDLRRNNWQQRRKIEGPKTIEQVHRDAAHERAQVGRSARGSGVGSSTRRGQPPPDYGSRGSIPLTTPGAQQVANTRSIPAQARGYGSQDVRMEKHIFESRTLSVPLSQRPMGDDSITLGPQGGLAKGMSSRGQPIMPNPPTSDPPVSAGENRRIVLGPNGHTSISDRNSYAGIRDLGKVDMMSDKRPGKNSVDQNSSSSAGTSGASPHSTSFSDDQLRDKSISAIREYYSAKDEKEVSLCVEELNSPGFYPTMVSLWVTDSFERKDMDRDLLSKLIVSLCKSRAPLLSQAQLIQGFDLVLASLEDAVNDAPRASEFLGRMFVRTILEDILSFREISRLIHEGGEEPGCLVEAGLAADVLGSILEIIKMEKGDTAVEELLSSSSLPLESFRPPHPMRSRKLEQFL